MFHIKLCNITFYITSACCSLSHHIKISLFLRRIKEAVEEQNFGRNYFVMLDKSQVRIQEQENSQTRDILKREKEKIVTETFFLSASGMEHDMEITYVRKCLFYFSFVGKTHCKENSFSLKKDECFRVKWKSFNVCVYRSLRILF